MTIDFLEQNGRTWGAPDVAIDAGAVSRVAAGAAELEEIVAWIKQRTTAR
jgi:predicted ribosome-associated RNA-binding protein Tma20